MMTRWMRRSGGGDKEEEGGVSIKPNAHIMSVNAGGRLKQQQGRGQGIGGHDDDSDDDEVFASLPGAPVPSRPSPYRSPAPPPQQDPLQDDLPNVGGSNNFRRLAPLPPTRATRVDILPRLA